MTFARLVLALALSLLRGVVVLVDVRRGIEADDAQLLDFLAAHRIPALVVVTKSDKLARGPRLERLAAITRQRPGITPIAFSASSGEGAAELWAAIDGLL